MAQVDATDEGDVALGSSGVADHHELLVMGSGGPDPHVQQSLRAGGLQLLTGLPVRPAGERELVPVRAPDQASDIDTTTIRRAEQFDHGRRRILAQPLIGVTAPVGEQDQVAGPGLLDPFLQLGEVADAVHQRADVISPRPRLVARVQSSSTVCSLARSPLVSNQSCAI